MAKFVEFKYFQPNAELKEKFLSQASGLGLNNIIKKSKGQLHCTFNKAVGRDNLYLVMVVGSSDYTLIRLAQEYGFPRGFPIIWVPDRFMQYYGFYPKFSNDERQTPDDLKEFDDVIGLSFFKKWSGFLGQCIVCDIDGEPFWTVSSKNGASNDSPFVQDAKRLFEPFMTPELVTEMAASHLHMCAEIMSKNDQVHGTRVLKESPVVTSIGCGCSFYLDGKKENIVQPKFVEFFDHSALVDFCVKYGIPCDSAIIINDNNAAHEFIVELSKKRDFINDEELQKLLAKHSGKVTIKKGTITHSEILGICLEGIVFRLHHANGTSSIKKYKFPGYTVRTMLFREEFKKFTFNPTLKNKAQSFVDYWCVTPPGKDYWFNFALTGFMKYLTFKPTDENVGSHIQLVESITDFVPLPTTSNEFDHMLNTLTNGTLILCLGPIGSGKTSMMNKICSLDPRLEAIDGDDLGIGMDKTLKTKGERNELTRSRVIESFLKEKNPVLSTGGGVTFSNGRDQSFILKSQIYETLGIICKIIVLVPGVVADFVHLDNQYDPTPVYDDPEPVKNAVMARVKSGQWKVDPKFKTGKTSDKQAIENFAKFIATKSKGNCEFAKKIIEIADNVFVFPVISSENYGVQDAFDYSELMSMIVYPRSKMSGKFGQIRLLTFINNEDVGHVTVQYSPKNDILMSWDQFNDLNNFYGSDPVDGNVIVMSSNDGKKISFAVPDKSYHPDGSTHITIDPGVHFPKEMRTAALSLKTAVPTILPTKDGKMIEYKVTSTTSCKITVCGSFGI
ncbi:hypothetical protein QKU48_gp1227 [Fadolivirus algeromassiliense]|jgi:hypothetical protein|uniref:Uncharacterized protein n=1 Tax=Fadolivirus FV1/VV64 TaxID=3070911 RepID=A0A7D3QV28_9VIRU|nr:hypothetical protein QKU48_gp1227 [Fadolivirus algeromassiliense]QKF94685.1 hypothetical protein Fadolivirus_1_1227 [Fadolivirus FV1/VV64]